MRLTIVELAVLVLHRAVDRASGQRIDQDDVRLALRCLLPHAADRKLLVEFWTYAGQLPNANRKDSCAAIMLEIVADLQASGCYPNDQTAHRRLLVDQLRREGKEQALRSAVKRRHYFAPPPRRQ